MSNIAGVAAYVAKATAQEKECMENLRICTLALAQGKEIPHIMEMIIKLRNLSRDVGWMRRLLADLRMEEEKKRGISSAV